MNDFMKKSLIAILIALVVGLLIGWRIVIFICSFIEQMIFGFELDNVIPVLLLITGLVFLFCIILLTVKKKAKYYKACIVTMTVAVSCLYFMFSYDTYSIMSVKSEGAYFASKNGKCGVFDRFGSDIYPFVYDKYLRFHKTNEYGIGILAKDDMYYVVNQNGNELVADRLVSPDFNSNLDERSSSPRMHTSGIDESRVYGFVFCMDGQFYLIDDTGELVIPMSFDAYVKDACGYNTLWVKNNQKWGAFDISSGGKQIVGFEYSNCHLANNGMILEKNSDVYLAQWDEGNLLFYNLSERQRQYEQNQRNAILLLMLFSSVNGMSNDQISQMNGLYQNNGVVGRSREQIQNDIDHLKELQSGAYGSGGIAESIGYGRIQGKYNELIADRERELIMANH